MVPVGPIVVLGKPTIHILTCVGAIRGWGILSLLYYIYIIELTMDPVGPVVVVGNGWPSMRHATFIVFFTCIVLAVAIVIGVVSSNFSAIVIATVAGTGISIVDVATVAVGISVVVTAAVALGAAAAATAAIALVAAAVALVTGVVALVTAAVALATAAVAFVVVGVIAVRGSPCGFAVARAGLVAGLGLGST